MSKQEYIKGEIYEGLGKYLGIQTVYPWGKDYAYTEHKFSAGPPDDGRQASDINTIFIKKIQR